jgi:hypothetical protein
MNTTVTVNMVMVNTLSSAVARVVEIHVVVAARDGSAVLNS